MDEPKSKFKKLSISNKIDLDTLAGVVVGDNLNIGNNVKLYYGNNVNIKIGNNVSIGDNCILATDSLLIEDNVIVGNNNIFKSEIINIGENTEFGEGSTVLSPIEFSVGRNSNWGNKNSVVCRQFKSGKFLQFYSDITVGEGGKYGVNSKVSIGDACFIGKGCVLNTSESITIGNDVGIGQQCMIWTHGAYLSVLNGFPADFGSVSIGDHVWIPARTVILPNVTVGSNVVIGINSLINKNIPSNCMAAGIPARVIKEKCYPHKLDNNKYNAIIEDVIARYKSLMKDKQIKCIIDYYPEKREIHLKQSKSETIFYLNSMIIGGTIDSQTEDFRDFLRRNGIKFFTDNKFKSIVPPLFNKFMELD